MADRNQDIRQRLLATFRVEAQEHLQVITANLLALERGVPPAQQRDLVEGTFREVHTLKGAARSVSLLDVEALCQAVEGVLSRMTRGDLQVNPPLLDLFEAAADSVARLLAGTETPGTARDLIGRLERAAGEAEDAGGMPPQAPAPAEEAPAAPVFPVAQTIRIGTGRLDAVLLQAEDLLALKLAARERAQEARALAQALSRLRDGARARRPGAGPAAGAGANGDLADFESALREVDGQARDLVAHLAGDDRTIARAVDGLQEEMRHLRLTPAATVLDLFPRMVRDLARQQAKSVEWAAHGGDLEVDRRVLEAMKDPLIHLVRNAVDHGIEMPEARARAGKPPAGRVAVHVTPLDGNRIEIRVEDDGHGVDLGQVRAAAVRSRLLAAAEAEGLSDEASLNLIFRSGFSTSPIITDLSGHGLGLTIVKERVEHLGGALDIDTRAGLGTAVRIVVPATIATFRGLLVRAGDQPFLLPLEGVERVVRIAPETVEHLEGRETIRWNGRALSVGRLADLLGLPSAEEPTADGRRPTAEHRTEERGPRTEAPDANVSRNPQPAIRNPQPPPAPRQPSVIVRSGEDRAALLVEEILGEREVLVKALRPPLVRVRHVAGAGLLGTGQVALILRPADLLRFLREAPGPFSVPRPHERARRPLVLVVDDSITTRTMERNLLEAAGYEVRVAADGVEAWTALKSEDVDLVVSDVDMPRMDGFDLTARIRADRKLADLPVVLVTALEAREDKERGIQVGANAYVIKSSFDQSNLLEIIRRLL